MERLGRRALVRRGVTSRTVMTPPATLHVYDAPGAGALPPIVLLHGIGAAATTFGPLLARLRCETVRVIAPEYPGHGFSGEATSALTVDVLHAAIAHALDELLDQPAILVGNSLGGAVALDYAVRRPERVRGLVLVSPAGARASDEDWQHIRATFDLRTRRDARQFIERLYHRAPWFAPLVAGELGALMRRPAVRDLLADACNDRLLAPEQLAALRVPILLLWGRSERILPRSLLDYFAQHLPKHTIIEEPDGFGHCPHFDDPGALARRIVEFARAA
jgi:pimeloyl-ACP methyl ester carboxylesterase